MATGTPVVCTDIGGVEDFAFDEETALLVPYADVPAMARAITRMIDDASLREKLAAAALAHVVCFDWDDSTNRLISIIEKHL